MKAAFRTRLAQIRAHSTDQTRQNCLALMRSTAQSVSVITTVLPGTPESEPVYHGATLSSFTSVSMHPYPLVAFSLRTPSRMAESLWNAPKLPRDHKVHMVINLLSATQAPLALQFSRSHEFKNPFASTPYFVSQDGIPVLRGSLGALSCALVGSWPLDGSDSPPSLKLEGAHTPGKGEQVSELFLARVLRVESGSGPEVELIEEREGKLPLVYHRQRYVTVQETTLLPSGSHASNPNERTP